MLQFESSSTFLQLSQVVSVHLVGTQVEHLVRCAPSAYQKALFSIVQQQLAGKGGSASQQRTVAISNSVMELRNICNHPTIRLAAHHAFDACPCPMSWSEMLGSAEDCVCGLVDDVLIDATLIADNQVWLSL